MTELVAGLTEAGRRRVQHRSMVRTVRVVAGAAIFANGLVLEEKGAALLSVTLVALVVGGQSGDCRLRRRPMGIVAADAGHQPFLQRVAGALVEVLAHLLMTAQTALGRVLVPQEGEVGTVLLEGRIHRPALVDVVAIRAADVGCVVQPGLPVSGTVAAVARKAGCSFGGSGQCDFTAGIDVLQAGTVARFAARRSIPTGEVDPAVSGRRLKSDRVVVAVGSGLLPGIAAVGREGVQGHGDTEADEADGDRR